jgi:hypothetical protein
LPQYTLAFREPFYAQEQEAPMLTKTAAALAAALAIGMTMPATAGEGAAQVDCWNHDCGGWRSAYGWSGWRGPGYAYGSPYAYGYPGYVYSPGVVYGGPRVVIEADINTGYVPRRSFRYGWD